MTEGPRLPLRDDLLGIEPYGAPQIRDVVQLNVNENPFPPSPELARALGAAVEACAVGLNRYPDREFTELRSDLAAYLTREAGVSIAAEQIWAANGSNEVMAHIFAAFGGPGRKAVAFAPTYSMYPTYARDSFTQLITGPRAADFSIDLAVAGELIASQRPSIVVIDSPNNPSGVAVEADVLESLIAMATKVGAVIVIDEAYAEFRRQGTPSALAHLAEHPLLIVTRTMSKAFAMAGARVGYLAAAPGVVDALRLVRLPYHLSAVTQAVARTALAFAEELQGQVDTLRRERDELALWLQDNGFTVAPSDANFLLFGELPDRRAVWQGLLDRGVLIRETGPSGSLRVTVGTPQENQLFREVLLATMERIGP